MSLIEQKPHMVVHGLGELAGRAQRRSDHVRAREHAQAATEFIRGQPDDIRTALRNTYNEAFNAQSWMPDFLAPRKQ